METREKLKQFGNIPITKDILVSILGEYKSPMQKLVTLEKRGDLMRIKRDLYVVSPIVTNKKISLGLIANHIYHPSYVSFNYALREYGLIPERVFAIKSMTTGRSREISTSLGEFSYQQCKPEYFQIGITMKQEDDITYMIATPEKALCDLIISTTGLNLRYIEETREYLEENIRFDMEALANMNTDIIKACAGAGKKEKTLLNIIKIINKL